VRRVRGLKPPDELKDWSKNDLVREVRRLRAIMREHAERRGDDARESSTQDPVIGGSPHGRGDALVDARAAVLLDSTEVVLIDTMRADDERVSMMLALAGRINYSDDRVENAYLMGPDGAAALVSQLVGLASRAAGDHARGGQQFAAEFKVDLERRMGELP
jgi:hypothetical protein